MIGKLIVYSGLYGLGSYFLDVPLRRMLLARQARKYADQRGLPLLNVGAGTGPTAMFGPTFYGDVNVDLSGRKDVQHGTPGEVSYADAQDLSAFADGQFGAVFASHLVEHLPDPEAAIREFLRVSGNDPDALFVITPRWWDPAAWAHPGHLWYATDGRGGTRGGRLIRIRDEFSPAMKQLTSLRGI